MIYVNTSQNNKIFEMLNNQQFLVNDRGWRCTTVERQERNKYFKFFFESFNYGSVSFCISEEQLVRANDMLGVIKIELINAVNDFEWKQKCPSDALKAYAEQDVIKTAEIYKEGPGGPMAYVKVDNLDKITPVGRNVGISMETITGVAMTSSNKLTINTISNTNQGENKMDVKMLAYVAANMDKVTELIDKWGTEEAWNINSIIMLDYTYEKDAVIKKNKVVDSEGNEVMVYTATVFKAKNGKWYSSLMNNKLHGVDFGDVINFFENDVLVINAKSFSENNGTVFVSKGQAV